MKPWEYRRKPMSTSKRVTVKDFQTNESKSHNLPPQTPLLNEGIPIESGDKAHYRTPLELADWQDRFKELRVEHPNGIILNAQPRHVHDAMERHPWGVTYTPDRYLLTSWGDVPKWALMDKRDLETGELLIAEQVAA